MANPHVTLISGPPRTGKTIYAQALKDRLYKEGNRVLVIEGVDEEVELFKRECASGKWDHIIATSNKPWRSTDSGDFHRINTVVCTSQI